MKLQAKTRSVLLVMGLSAAGLVQADTTYTYTYDYSWSVNGCSGSWNANCGLTGTQSGSSVTPSPAPADPNAPSASIGATATGWANTEGNSSTYSSQTLEKGELRAWSGGLGVRNLDYSTTANGGESRIDTSEGTDPEHATDNNERYDSILYSFNQAISLTGVSFSWYSTSSGYNDSDITVLAYTGDTSVVGFNIESKLTGLKYDELVANGWTFVQQIGGSASYSKAISPTTSSSYWLIGAANPLVNGATLDGSKDAIKIASLTGKVTTQYTKQDTPSVPEPGSLALLGLGSLILVRARARKS
jgi:hypothetical protein